MASSELKNRVIYLLSTLDVYLPNAAKTQHVVRCPYCGDSNNPTHGHFSIKINTEDESAMVYRCLKCDASGALTVDVLEDLGLAVGEDVSSELKRFNRNLATKSKGYSTAVNRYIIPEFPKDSYVNRAKLEYINYRLGINLDYEEAAKQKIIIDFYEFLRMNDIRNIPGLNQQHIDILQNYYVGFLSKNNNFITFRNITSKGKRYLKFKFNPNSMNPDNFYVVPKATDILYTHDIDINIAEGTFDILSVKYNVNHDYDNEQYYFAVCGYGYPSIIRYLVYAGFTTGLNIHIYSDKDKPDREYVKTIVENARIRPWIKLLDVHRNFFPGEKDFGVPSDRIQEKTRKLYNR